MGQYLDKAGVQKLWDKTKTNFGASLDKSTATDGLSIILKDKAATPNTLSTLALPTASASQAGVMTATQASKLNGIAAGATAVTDSTVSGWGYKKTDNNTTYTLTQDSSDGHKLTFTPSTGNATTITIPDNNTTYESKTAASGGTAVSLVTTGEKYTWNNKGTYSKPSGGIPKTDLASAVQTSLGLADTAIQSHQSLANYYTKSEVDSAISSASAGTSTFAGSFSDVFTTGVVGNGVAITTKVAVTKGSYCVVGDAFDCPWISFEPGDMIFFKADTSSSDRTATISDFNSKFVAVQANISPISTSELETILV